jgi:hypothetical protein
LSDAAGTSGETSSDFIRADSSLMPLVDLLA